MKKHQSNSFYLTAGLLSCLFMSATMSKNLSIERIFDSPSLSGTSMRNLNFSPDGQRVTFLQGKETDKDQLDLWEYHIQTNKKQLLVDSKVLIPNEKELSAEEKARRERQRIASFKGIVSYSWSNTSDQLLFPLGGNLYVYNLESSNVKQLTDSSAFDTDAKFSPLGNYVSFIRNQNIYIVKIKSGKEKQLTFDGKGVIKNGMAEFVAQEEMDRDTGYWWSPDEKRIAYIQVDESPVEITKRYEINADTIEVVEQRYPYTGEANVTVKLAILNIDSLKTKWVDLGEDTDIYLPRVQWLPNAKKLSYQLQSRDQQTLTLYFANTKGKSKLILTETSDTWINLHKDLYFLNSGDFIWASERDGYKHLYLYSNDGELQQQITEGHWVVDHIESVNESTNTIYYSGTYDSATEKNLYTSPIKSKVKSTPQRMTKANGWHSVNVDKTSQYYIDNYSNRNQPESTTLFDINGKEVVVLNQNKIDASHPYYPYLKTHQDNRFGTLKAEDGQELNYRIILPVGFDKTKKYPVYVYTYGGPHAQVVTNAWGNPIEQYMAQQGFIVFALDNRGSYRRGVAFEAPLYKQMGTPEIADQVVGVDYLKTLNYVDSERIGIFGWSYGGFMTLKALTTVPDVFAMGVSVAPVTDYKLYDTFYTERYMSTPQLNPDGYKKTAVFDDVKNINKPLLVIHGMADDNVLFTNSTKLFKVMQDQGVLFDSMIYPGAKHGMSGQKTHTHTWKMITQYFIKHLKND